MSSVFLTGGYTESGGGHAQGIGLVRPTGDGALLFAGVAASASSPSFLVHGGLEGVLYAVDEPGNRVLAFEGPSGGTLRTLGWQRSSGTAPCHLSATSDWLYSSNYGTGEIDVFPLGHDGSIGPLYETVVPASCAPGPRPAQDGPHAHSTLVLGDTVLGADLGCDSVGVHRWVDGHLILQRSIVFPPGTGPRDFAVGPGGRVFVLGELSGALFELAGLDTDTPAIARSAPSSAAPVAGDHAAGLVVSPDGRHLYTGLRGSNRIAVVALDDLAPVAAVGCGGNWPRHLAIDGGILLVACERSGTVSVLPIDPATGIPGSGASIEVPTPTYLLAASH